MPSVAQQCSAARAIEVADGLYRLGGTVSLDGRLSWAPPEAFGYEPISCYLVVAPGGALLIDTGVTLHREDIKRQIRELTEPGLPLSIALTRFEPDCLINLTALRDTFDVHRVYGGGVSNPFDFFEDVFDEAASAAQVRATPEVELMRRRPGDEIALPGNRTLTLLGTSLRLLTTFWIYDHRTGTLFTSDAFGYRSLPDPDGVPVLDTGADGVDSALLAAHLFTKFEWLRGAETASIAADLHSVFASHDVQRLCPSHGVILEGRETVAAHVQAVAEILEEVDAGAQPDRPARQARHADPGGGRTL